MQDIPPCMVYLKKYFVYCNIKNTKELKQNVKLFANIILQTTEKQ